MTTKEFITTGAEMVKNEGTKAYLKWYVKNVWKMTVIRISVIVLIAALVGLTVATVFDTPVTAKTFAEQNMVTTAGYEVTVYNGYFDGEIIHYGIDNVESIWMTLGESKVFREAWKRNFQLSDNRWVDPEGKIASWDYIVSKASNSRRNVYFGYMDIDGEKLRIPEDIDTEKDLWLIDINMMATAKIEAYDGVVEYTEYDEEGNVKSHVIDENEFDYNRMKTAWFE